MPSPTVCSRLRIALHRRVEARIAARFLLHDGLPAAVHETLTTAALPGPTGLHVAAAMRHRVVLRSDVLPRTRRLGA